MNDFLTKNDFLSLPEPEVKKVYIKSLNKHVYIKQMSAIDQDSYDWSTVNIEDDPNSPNGAKVSRNLEGSKAKYLVRVLCDDRGQRLFNDNEYRKIGSKKSEIINELHHEALKVNGALKEDVEEQRKNSNAAQEKSSNSD